MRVWFPSILAVLLSTSVADVTQAQPQRKVVPQPVGTPTAPTPSPPPPPIVTAPNAATAVRPSLPEPVRAVTGPAHVWSKILTRSFSPSIEGVARSASGDVYMAGYFRSGALAFPGQPTLSANDRDALLIKARPDGTVVWAKQFGTQATTGFSEEEATAVAVDPSGNVIVVGKHVGPIDFGGGPLPRGTNGFPNIFVAKLDASGGHVWSKDLGDGIPKAVTTDGAGNVIVTGASGGSNAILGTSTAAENVFIAKLAPSGALSWAKVTGGKDPSPARGYAVNDNRGNAVVCDAQGNVFVTGTFQGTIDLGGGPVVSTRQLDVFVAALTPAGAPVWVKSFGGGDFDIGRTIAITPKGALVVAGVFRGVMNLAGTELRDLTGDGTPFIARLGAGGAPVWARVLPTRPPSSRAYVRAIAGGDGEWIWMTGTVEGTSDLGKGNVTTSPDEKGVPTSDAFLAGIDAADGTTRFATLFRGPTRADEPVMSVRGMNVLLAGTTGSADLGGGALPTTRYESHVFLAEWASGKTAAAMSEKTTASANEACSSEMPCDAAFACVKSPIAPVSMCRPKPKLGDSCVAQIGCADAVCSGEGAAARCRLAKGAPCRTADQCVSGSCKMTSLAPVSYACE